MFCLCLVFALFICLLESFSNLNNFFVSVIMPLKGFFRKTKTSTSSTKSAEEESAMSIGEPFNVKRNYHVGFDKEKGEFVGLPESWEQLLSHSNIS